jgi:chaperonin GroEL
MPQKQVLFRSVSREKLSRGAGHLTDVYVTLGPKSKSVLIQKKSSAPLVCNDGVTIAKEIDLKDAEEDLGVQMTAAGRREDG